MVRWRSGESTSAPVDAGLCIPLRNDLAPLEPDKLVDTFSPAVLGANTPPSTRMGEGLTRSFVVSDSDRAPVATCDVSETPVHTWDVFETPVATCVLCALCHGLLVCRLADALSPVDTADERSSALGTAVPCCVLCVSCCARVCDVLEVRLHSESEPTELSQPRSEAFGATTAATAAACSSSLVFLKSPGVLAGGLVWGVSDVTKRVTLPVLRGIL